MRGWLGLGGGDEFGPTCESGDRALLDAIGGMIHIAVVPTAQADGGSNPVRAGNHGVRYFERLGASAENVLIVDRASAASTQFVARLGKANLIYVIGGNPGYLLRTLRDTPAMQAISDAWQNGVAVVGSSAGAMLVCAAQLDGSHGSRSVWTRGIGFVPRVLAAAHHEGTSDAEGIRIRQLLPAEYTVLGIDACSLAVWRPDGLWQMFGNGSVRVYTPGADHSRRYVHNQTWSLPAFPASSPG